MMDANPAFQRTALVFGASRGIGAAIAERFVLDGEKVYGTHRGTGTPEGVTPLEADIRDDQSIADVFKTIHNQAGRLDTVVINAGVAEQRVIPRLDRDDARALFEVNTFGPMIVLKHAARLMNRQRDGSVVLISSESARAGIPGSSHYTASKAALEGFMRSAMWEFGPRGIRINVVAPGSTQTDMFARVDAAHQQALIARTPLARIAHPNEIAEVVAWVSRSTYLTGACIPVTGGEGLGY